MQIDPKTKIVFYCVLAVAGVVAAMTPSAFPDFVTPGIAANIAKIAGIAVTVMSAISGVLAGASSSKPGPLAPQDAEVVVRATELQKLSTIGASDASIDAAKIAVVQAAKQH